MNKFIAIGSIVIVCLAAVSAFIGFAMTSQAAQIETQETRRIFYITQSQTFVTMDGGEAVILDYARDGEMQTQAVFKSIVERDDFIAHLEIFGPVVNKGALK
jgi:hypothetical protein